MPSGANNIVLNDNSKFPRSFRLCQHRIMTGSVNIGGSTVSLGSVTTAVPGTVDLTVPQSVGGQSVLIDTAVELTSGQTGTPITITNQLPGVSVAIPDSTTILAPSGWTGTSSLRRPPRLPVPHPRDSR